MLTKEYSMGPLLRAKFGRDHWREGDVSPTLQNIVNFAAFCIAGEGATACADQPGMEEYIIDLLLQAKFGHDRWQSEGLCVFEPRHVIPLIMSILPVLQQLGDP